MQIQNLCLLALFIAIFTSHTTSAARFNFEHFDGSNLVFLGDAELGSTADGSSLSGALSMTRDSPPFSHGQGLYTGEIPFKLSNSSSTTYSFKTSFTFSISPRRKSNPSPGHGLAFIVVPSIDNDGAAGKGFLGLLNRTNNGNPNNHVFAVEFDVFQDKDLGDINDNHVGIDINSVKSTVSEKAGFWVQTRTGEGKKVWEFKKLKLSSGDKYKSWVEYDNVTKLVTVTIAPAYLSKPKKPLIETQIDLSKVFLGNMFTGFAGSMGREVERHDIWTWRFENNAPKETKPVQSG
ncbi:unnamed protein product [Eruca vesicaria subsp. sativa]|uniref:Legume lectin domain-containing protein n=1 Tax=Eruca vesicaria subsp. sativa TaxID=29727 RepID=A0ABC8LKC6_ERUVS|nr:unnamed protein product [Eruca vesicaria subsp. sativa]